MAMNRKGFVFTLVAIFVSALLISLYTADRTSNLYAEDSVAAASRVGMMNAFITTVEQHAAQSLGAAGFFALERMNDWIYNETDFLTNLDANLTDCIVNNTIEILGNVYDCLPENTLVNSSLEVLANISYEELGITLTYDIGQVWMTDSAPMEVTFWMNFSYNVSDIFASWVVVNRTISAVVYAGGMRDPLYVFLNSSAVTNEVRVFSLTDYRPAEFNGAVFDDFYNSRSYILWQGASPSIAQRFTGDVTSTSSCCGIESVMNSTDLDFSYPRNLDKTFQNYSMTDHGMVGHIRNFNEYKCLDREVRKLVREGSHLSLSRVSFDNPYNLSGSPDDVDTCTWP